MSFNGNIVISRCVISDRPATAGVEGGAYCTGGTVAISGGKRIHTFTGDGTLVVVNAGDVEYLVVAGGGGGGGTAATNAGAAGGGAGGMITGTTSLAVGNTTVTIGAGGPGGSTAGTKGTNGADSVLGVLTATGGGGGGGSASIPGANGGSGGGACWNGAVGTGSQGEDGGAGSTSAPNYGGGGGGGNTAAGGAASGTNGGTGGNGTSSSISGAAVTYAGGGGGGTQSGGTGGPGGAGGGGAGHASAGTGTAGTINTGGGGGGGGADGATGGAGGAGGSGIVIVSYDNPFPTVTGGESADAITLNPRPSPGMIGWRKCSASERAEGGYYRANITMVGPLDYLADFMLSGLMRDVRFYGPDGVQCWEGFVYEMTLNRKTAEIKISMDRVANNVWMRYRVTGSGTTVRSTAQTDADSQARYGIRDYVLTGGELENSSVADAKCKQYLALNRQPKPTRSGPGRPDEEYSLEIICRGYFDTLNNQCYNATGGSSQGAAGQISDIITAKGQFVASSSYGANATPVSEVYDVDRRTGDVIQDIARLGDSSYRRWLARMGNNRIFYFQSAARASRSGT